MIIAYSHSSSQRFLRKNIRIFMAELGPSSNLDSIEDIISLQESNLIIAETTNTHRRRIRICLVVAEEEEVILSQTTKLSSTIYKITSQINLHLKEREGLCQE
jgi:hypothetical protein